MQILLISIMVVIIQPTIALKSYSSLWLLAEVYISHITALFFLVMLILTLVYWFMAKSDMILLLYTISFALTAITIMTSLLYATYVLSNQPSNVRPLSFHQSLLNTSTWRTDCVFGNMPLILRLCYLSYQFGLLQQYCYMGTYSKRIGKIRSWMITSIR